MTQMSIRAGIEKSKRKQCADEGSDNFMTERQWQKGNATKKTSLLARTDRGQWDILCS